MVNESSSRATPAVAGGCERFRTLASVAAWLTEWEEVARRDILQDAALPSVDAAVAAAAPGSQHPHQYFKVPALLRSLVLATETTQQRLTASTRRVVATAQDVAELLQWTQAQRPSPPPPVAAAVVDAAAGVVASTDETVEVATPPPGGPTATAAQGDDPARLASSLPPAANSVEPSPAQLTELLLLQDKCRFFDLDAAAAIEFIDDCIDELQLRWSPSGAVIDAMEGSSAQTFVAQRAKASGTDPTVLLLGVILNHVLARYGIVHDATLLKDYTAHVTTLSAIAVAKRGDPDGNDDDDDDDDGDADEDGGGGRNQGTTASVAGGEEKINAGGEGGGKEDPSRLNPILGGSNSAIEASAVLPRGSRGRLATSRKLLALFDATREAVRASDLVEVLFTLASGDDIDRDRRFNVRCCRLSAEDRLAFERTALRLLQREKITAPTSIAHNDPLLESSRVVIDRRIFAAAWKSATGGRLKKSSIDRIFGEDTVIPLQEFLDACGVDANAESKQSFALRFAMHQKSTAETVLSFLAYVPFVILFTYFLIAGDEKRETASLQQSVMRSLVREPFPAVEATYPCEGPDACGATWATHEKDDFTTLKDQPDLWDWTLGLFVPTIRPWSPPTKYYLHRPTSNHLNLADPVGPFRLTFVRVNGEDDVDSYDRYINALSKRDYQKANAQQHYPRSPLGSNAGGIAYEVRNGVNTTSLLNPWSLDSLPASIKALPALSSQLRLMEAFRYRTCEELNATTGTVRGKRDSFACGGFAVVFPATLTGDELVEELQALRDSGLATDKAVQALLFEQIFYNKDADVLLRLTVLIELTSVGYYASSIRTFPMSLQRGGWTSPRGVLLIVHGLFDLIWLVAWLRGLFRFVSDYFNTRAITVGALFRALGQYTVGKAWNLATLLTIMSLLIAWGLRASSLVNLASLKQSPYYPQWFSLEISQLVSNTDLLQTFDGVNAVLVYAQILKYLSLIPAVELVLETVRRSLKSLLGVGLIFAILFTGFTFAFHIAFGNELPQFAFIDFSAMECSFMILGDIDLDAMNHYRPYLTPILYVMFVLVMIVLMLNIIVVVFTDTFTQVNENRLSAFKFLTSLDADAHTFFTRPSIGEWMESSHTLAELKYVTGSISNRFMLCLADDEGKSYLQGQLKRLADRNPRTFWSQVTDSIAAMHHGTRATCFVGYVRLCRTLYGGERACESRGMLFDDYDRLAQSRGSIAALIRKAFGTNTTQATLMLHFFVRAPAGILHCHSSIALWELLSFRMQHLGDAAEVALGTDCGEDGVFEPLTHVSQRVHQTQRFLRGIRDLRRKGSGKAVIASARKVSRPSVAKLVAEYSTFVTPLSLPQCSVLLRSRQAQLNVSKEAWDVVMGDDERAHLTALAAVSDPAVYLHPRVELCAAGAAAFSAKERGVLSLAWPTRKLLLLHRRLCPAPHGSSSERGSARLTEVELAEEMCALDTILQQANDEDLDASDVVVANALAKDIFDATAEEDRQPYIDAAAEIFDGLRPHYAPLPPSSPEYSALLNAQAGEGVAPQGTSSSVGAGGRGAERPSISSSNLLDRAGKRPPPPNFASQFVANERRRLRAFRGFIAHAVFVTVFTLVLLEDRGLGNGAFLTQENDRLYGTAGATLSNVSVIEDVAFDLVRQSAAWWVWLEGVVLATALAPEGDVSAAGASSNSSNTVVAGSTRRSAIAQGVTLPIAGLRIRQTRSPLVDCTAYRDRFWSTPRTVAPIVLLTPSDNDSSVPTATPPTFSSLAALRASTLRIGRGECLPAFAWSVQQATDRYGTSSSSSSSSTSFAGATASSDIPSPQDAFRYETCEWFGAVGTLTTLDDRYFPCSGFGTILASNATLENATAFFAELRASQWIDFQTTSVTVDLVQFNYNARLYSKTTLVAYVSSGGGWSTQFRNVVFRPFAFVANRSVRGLAVVISFLAVLGIALLAYVVGFVVAVRSQRRSALRGRGWLACLIKEVSTDPWWVINGVNYALFVAVWSLRAYCANLADGPTPTEFGGRVANVDLLSEAQVVASSIDSVNTILTYARFLYYFRLHPVTNVLSRTIAIAMPTLLAIAGIVIVTLFAFTVSGMILFSHVVGSYSSVSKALWSLTQLLFGGGSTLDELRASRRLIGAFFFAAFFLTAILLLLNLVLATMTLAFVKARNEVFCADALDFAFRNDPLARSVFPAARAPASYFYRSLWTLVAAPFSAVRNNLCRHYPSDATDPKAAIFSRLALRCFEPYEYWRAVEDILDGPDPWGAWCSLRYEIARQYHLANARQHDDDDAAGGDVVDDLLSRGVVENLARMRRVQQPAYDPLVAHSYTQQTPQEIMDGLSPSTWISGVLAMLSRDEATLKPPVSVYYYLAALLGSDQEADDLLDLAQVFQFATGITGMEVVRAYLQLWHTNAADAPDDERDHGDDGSTKGPSAPLPPHRGWGRLPSVEALRDTLDAFLDAESNSRTSA